MYWKNQDLVSTGWRSNYSAQAKYSTMASRLFTSELKETVVTPMGKEQFLECRTQKLRWGKTVSGMEKNTHGGRMQNLH